jgi:hypothetical protein
MSCSRDSISSGDNFSFALRVTIKSESPSRIAMDWPRLSCETRLGFRSNSRIEIVFIVDKYVGTGASFQSDHGLTDIKRLYR